MQAIIETIEATAIATWVRESPSIFAYTTVLSLHAMGLAIVVGVSAVVTLRLAGVARGIPLASTLKLYPLMYAGFAINALSGLALLAANAGGMLENIVFLVKMGLIVVAMICMELLRSRITDDVGLLDDEATSPRTRALGIAALTAWSAVLIGGRLTAYPNLVASWFT